MALLGVKFLEWLGVSQLQCLKPLVPCGAIGTASSRVSRLPSTVVAMVPIMSLPFQTCGASRRFVPLIVLHRYALRFAST